MKKHFDSLFSGTYLFKDLLRSASSTGFCFFFLSAKSDWESGTGRERESASKICIFYYYTCAWGQGSSKMESIVGFGSTIIRSVHGAVQCWLNYNRGICLFFLSRDKAGSYP